MLLLICFLLGPAPALWASVRFKQRMELFLPCAFMANTVALYWFGVFHLLLPGVWIIAAANLLLLLSGWRAALRDKAAVRENFFTPGLAAYLFWSIFFYFVDSGRLLCDWDEFSLWGIAAKAVSEYDDLPCRLGSVLNFSSYQPGMALLQYFYLQLPNSYSEGAILFANSHFLLSFLSLGLYRARWRDWQINLPYILLVWLMPLLFLEFFYSAYVDGALGMTFALAVLLLLLQEKTSRLHWGLLAITLSFLVLIKSSGNGFYLAALLFAAATLLPEWRANLHRVRWWAAAALLLPMLNIISWKILLKLNGCAISYSGKGISVNSLYDAIMHNIPSHSHQVIRMFFGKIFTNIPPGPDNCGVGSFTAVLLIAGILCLLARFCRAQNLKRNLYFAAILLPLAGAAYSLALLSFYIFDFMLFDALSLASAERYLNTFSVGCYFIATVAAMYCFRRNRPHGKTAMYLALFLLLLPLAASPLLSMRWRHVISRNYCRLRSPQVLGGQQWQRVLQPTDKIALWAQGTKGEEYFVFRYLALGHAVVAPWSFRVAQSPADYWSVPINAASLLKSLTGVNYVYLLYANDCFRLHYSELFADPSRIYSGRLYRKGADARLQLVPLPELTLDLTALNFLKNTVLKSGVEEWRPGGHRLEFTAPGGTAEFRPHLAPVFDTADFRTLTIEYECRGTPPEVTAVWHGAASGALRLTAQSCGVISIPLPGYGTSGSGLRLKFSAAGVGRIILKKLYFADK